MVTWVHSFSTRPVKMDVWSISGLGRLICNTWYFALSLAYLKRVGRRVILHTDSLGKAFLGHLPYDEIHTTLNDMEEGGMFDFVNPRFWAAGKFVALAATSGPCIHIDGDVFIKRPSLAKDIEARMQQCDMLYQHLEQTEIYEADRPVFRKDLPFCDSHFCPPESEEAFNTGLMGISSEKLKRELVDNYFSIVRHFSENFPDDLKDSRLSPDLIAEQVMARRFTEAKGYKCKPLLANRDEATKVGYQHVYTLAKFKNMGRCMETLKAINNQIYRDTFLLCGKVPELDI